METMTRTGNSLGPPAAPSGSKVTRREAGRDYDGQHVQQKAAATASFAILALRQDFLLTRAQRVLARFALRWRSFASVEALWYFSCLFFNALSRCFLVFLALSGSSSELKSRRLGKGLAVTGSLLALPPGILLPTTAHARSRSRASTAGCLVTVTSFHVALRALLARALLVFPVFLVQAGPFALGCTGALVEQRRSSASLAGHSLP